MDAALNKMYWRVQEFMGSRAMKWLLNGCIALMVLFLIFEASMFALRDKYRIGRNVSDSLPGYVFIIEVGKPPVPGDVVAFRYHRKDDTLADPYPEGVTFMKLFAGREGDVVALRGDRHVLVNGQDMGYVKEVSKMGQKLEPVESGSIPKGKYFMRGLHRDSYDSRYSMMGLIDESQIIGRAFKVF